jgi:hypothetical protein
MGGFLFGGQGAYCTTHTSHFYAHYRSKMENDFLKVLGDMNAPDYAFGDIKHGKYDCRPAAMCGQIMKYCSLEADATLWYQIQPVITTTLMNHCKDCIKRLNGRFKGMSSSQGSISCTR